MSSAGEAGRVQTGLDTDAGGMRSQSVGRGDDSGVGTLDARRADQVAISSS